MRFSTEKEAKEFLVAEIVAEACRKGTPLSEIERKMLYFTESGWTLSDMSEVAAAFDRDYNQSEYEHKIRKLDANKAKVWSSSIKRLDVGDHYLLVMLDLARTDCGLRKSLLALVVICGGCVAFLLAVSSYLGHFPDREEGGFFLWLAMSASVLAYFLGILAFGREAVERFVDRVLDAVLFTRSKRSEMD